MGVYYVSRAKKTRMLMKGNIPTRALSASRPVPRQTHTHPPTHPHTHAHASTHINTHTPPQTLKHTHPPTDTRTHAPTHTHIQTCIIHTHAHTHTNTYVPHVGGVPDHWPLLFVPRTHVKVAGEVPPETANPVLHFTAHVFFPAAVVFATQEVASTPGNTGSVHGAV